MRFAMEESVSPRNAVHVRWLFHRIGRRRNDIGFSATTTGLAGRDHVRRRVLGPCRDSVVGAVE
jgi:hypothetical protein